MSPETILLILVLLACPVAMIFLHRGAHRPHHGTGEIAARPRPTTTDGDETGASV